MTDALADVSLTDDGDEALLPGERVGRYEVVRALGRGGFGHVYEALHRELDKRVALKVLLRDHAAHPVVRARFAREGVVAARLRHPNVVDVTDVGVCDGQPYLVMELLEGETLRALLAREGPLALDRALDLMLPVIDAVSAAHAAGLVHRDLKPDNIFLARSGPRGGVVPKVLDFGVVKSDDASLARGALATASGALLGTPAYMSPEQALGRRDLDARSDVFSLASIVYECLAGRRAFEGDAVLPVLQRVSEATVPPLASLRDDLPDEVDAALAAAFARDPDERCPSARAFAESLLPFASARARADWSAAHEGRPLPPPAPASPRDRSPAPREVGASPSLSRRATASLALPVAAVLIVGAGLAAWAARANTDDLPAAPSAPVARSLPAPPPAPPPLQPAAPVVDASVAATPPVAVAPVAATVVEPPRARPTRDRGARASAQTPRATPSPAVRVGANGAVIED